MDSFALLLGHLTGDYIVQNDWMAANKTAWGHDVLSAWQDVSYIEQDGTKYPRGTSVYHNAMVDEAIGSVVTTRKGHITCTVHCLCYTLAVWLFSFWWMPWWGLLLCFAIHWPVDRFRLARWWMEHVSGQAAFASGPLAPWSIIVVDNVFHLLTLYGIWLLTGVI